MAFFRTVSFTEQLPSIAGEGVFLRAPQMADFPEWAALREESRDFLGNEFLLWLWYTLENETDTLKLADGSEATLMLARTLTL